MNCQNARESMMDRLYDGHSSPALDEHLRSCPQCQEEWKHIQSSHRVLQSWTPEPSSMMEEQVLQASQKRNHSSRTIGSFSRPMTAAASFLILLIAGGIYWGSQRLIEMQAQQSQDSFIAMNDRETKSDQGKQPQHEIEELKPRPNSEKEKLFAMDAEPLSAGRNDEGFQPKRSMISSSLVENSTVKRSQPKSNETLSAEEFFHTGLQLYNQAFTKIGNDRKILLQSAVLYLQDLKDHYPERNEWIALAHILLADSYKHLGETQNAIAVYHDMINSNHGMEPYCKQARASLIRLMLNHESSWEEVDRAFQTYSQIYPNSDDKTNLKFTVAEWLQNNNPKLAFRYYQDITKSHRPQSSVHSKAARLAAAMQRKLDDILRIKDWWVLGPLPNIFVKEDVLPAHPQHRVSIDKSRNLSWKRPFAGESGKIDFREKMESQGEFTSVFLYNQIDVPEEMDCFLRIQCGTGIKIWVHNDPTYSALHLPYDEIRIPCHFQKGINQLLIQLTYHEESETWPFSLLIVDEENNILSTFDINHEVEMKPDANQ